MYRKNVSTLFYVCFCMFQDFYDRIGRRELYVVYLHKLCDLHLLFDNFTEAAHVKMLYSKLLEVTLPPPPPFSPLLPSPSPLSLTNDPLLMHPVFKLLF